MGGGSWNTVNYVRNTGAKIKSGTTFEYTTHAKATGTYVAHELLDPKKLNKAGLNIREARDSDEHPNTVPIVVGFDVTGSMGTVPRVVQEKLAGLFGLLTRKGYVEDPTISVAAYGDAFCDRVPLQVSQFEADNRVDISLDSILIESGGGGNSGETMNLLWYYLATHTETDAWEKRGKKGYAFFIADEKTLPLLPEQVEDFVGDGQPRIELDTKNIAEKLKEKWEVIILLIDNTTAKWQGSEAHYVDLFGRDNVIIVENPETISETIGTALGFLEGTLDNVDDAADDLREVGATELAIRHTTKAVANLAKLSKGAVAKINTHIEDDETSQTMRL